MELTEAKVGKALSDEVGTAEMVGTLTKLEADRAEQEGPVETVLERVVPAATGHLEPGAGYSFWRRA